MKKKILIALLAIVSTLCLALGLAACDVGGDGEHTHTFSDKWSSDSTYHWHAATCGCKDIVADKAEHDFDRGICKVCKYIDDAYIAPQSKILIENYLQDEVYKNIDEEDIQAQNWQLILDDENLNGCIATYLYATQNHTHILCIDKISFTLPLDKLVLGDFVTFDATTAEIENKVKITASLVQTYAANSDESVKTMVESFAETDGYSNNITVVLQNNNYYLLQCNSGKSAVYTISKSGSLTETKSFTGRQVTGLVLNYTVQEHRYYNSNFCDATGCNYDGLEYTNGNGGYTVSGRGEVPAENLEILSIPSMHNNLIVNKISDNAFSGCKYIYNVTLPASIKSIGSKAFYNCERISDITLPGNLESIGSEAFEGCLSLYTMHIPQGVTSIGYEAFYNCPKLIEVSSYFENLKSGDTSYGYLARYAKHVYTPSSGEFSRISETGDFKFFEDKDNGAYILIAADFYLTKESYDNDNINYLELPATVKQFGRDIAYTYTVYDYALSCLYGLKSITIPAPSGGAGITSIANTAFYGCKNLAEIKVTKGNYNFSSQDGILYNKEKTQIVFVPKAIKGNVTIPQGVTSIGEYTFSGCTSLESIEIPDSVTTIGSNAFEKCTSLTSVTIGSGVTTIGGYAFSHCTSLTSVTIGSGVTSIGSWAFEYCTSLKGVYITDLAAWCKIGFGFDANPLSYAHKLYLNNNLVTDITADMLQGVTSIGRYAFEDCTSLESITIPDGVTSIGYGAFSHCTSLENIEIPDSVTTIGDYAFQSCYSLESIEIPNSVTEIGEWAFYLCTSLTSVTIGSGVTEIGEQTFSLCTSLTSVTIGSGVTEIGRDAFSDCTKLTSITIPNSVTTIGYEAFSGCDSLTSIEIPDGVTTIGGSAFSGCDSLTSIEIPDSVTYIGRYAFEYCTSLESVTIGSGTIGESAFENCTSLTSVTIGSGVTTIGEDAFDDCTSLEGVYITDLAAWCEIDFGDGYSNPLYYAEKLYLNNNLVTNITADMLQDVTSIGNAFEYCTSLESIEIPDSVTAIGSNAFEYCTSLTSVTIGSGVTEIGRYAFYYCTSLTSVTIPDSVTTIGSSAFSDCYKLLEVYNLSSLPITAGSNDYGYVGYYALNVYNSLDIPSKLDKRDDGYVFCTDGEEIYLVGYNGNETALQLPANYNGRNYKINNYAFYKNTQITSVIIPDSVTSIGREAFRGCTSLTSVTIGSGVTEIGRYAFYYCTSLTSVTIGSGVTTIGAEAFYYCTSLESVTFANTTGWKVSGYSNMSNSRPAPDLSNPTQNAEYLRSTYSDYYWKRG